MPSHNTAILLELMCEYANLQCECSNKKYGVGQGGSGGGSRRGGVGKETLSPWIYEVGLLSPPLAFNETGVKGLPRLTMEQTAVGWQGPGIVKCCSVMVYVNK